MSKEMFYKKQIDLYTIKIKKSAYPSHYLWVIKQYEGELKGGKL